MIYNNANFKEERLFMNDYINLISEKLNDKDDNSIYDLENNMSKFQKEIFTKMKEDNDFLTNYSLNDLLFDFDSYFVEKLLDIELDIYLKECEKRGIENKRNGYTKGITLTTSNREFNFNRPRLRNEKNFDSVLIPKRTRIIDDLHNNIILLYSKNNSVNDIKEILNGMFNINLSTAYISNVTQKVAEHVFEWRNRTLEPCYFAINIDCLYITIRDNKCLNSHKIPVYIAVGTTLQGNKEIVGMYLGNEDEDKNLIDSFSNKNISESKSFWLEVFNDLKDRGVKKVLYIVSDGVTGLTDAIKDEFSNTFHQICVVHLVRNLKKYTNKNESKQIIYDFKQIYSAPNKEIALLKYDEFKTKYSDKKTMLKHAEDYIKKILPLFDIPENIRKYIYTNNIVESVNSKIQRGFYGRGALPNKESAINIIYLNLIDLENKWKKHKVSNWNKIYNEILLIHYDEIKEYL